MTSGDTLVQLFPQDNEPPVSANGLAFATLNTTPGNHPQLCLEFDQSIAQYANFTFEIPRSYGGGGITSQIVWAAASATTGQIVLAGSFDRRPAGVSVSSASYATTVAVTVSCSTQGIIVYSTVAFTDGAQIDSLAGGEMGRFLLTRLLGSSNTMAGLAQIYAIEFKET